MATFCIRDRVSDRSNVVDQWHTIAPPSVIQTVPEVIPRPIKLRRPKLRCNSCLCPDTLTPASRLFASSVGERAEEEDFFSIVVGGIVLSSTVAILVPSSTAETKLEGVVLRESGHSV